MMDHKEAVSADLLAEQILEAQPDLQTSNPDLSPLERAHATRTLILKMKSGTAAQVVDKIVNASEAAEQVNEAVGEKVIDPRMVSLSIRLRDARHRRAVRLGNRTLTRLY